MRGAWRWISRLLLEKMGITDIVVDRWQNTHKSAILYIYLNTILYLKIINI